MRSFSQSRSLSPMRSLACCFPHVGRLPELHQAHLPQLTQTLQSASPLQVPATASGEDIRVVKATMTMIASRVIIGRMARRSSSAFLCWICFPQKHLPRVQSQQQMKRAHLLK